MMIVTIDISASSSKVIGWHKEINSINETMYKQIWFDIGEETITLQEEQGREMDLFVTPTTLIGKKRNVDANGGNISTDAILIKY